MKDLYFFIAEVFLYTLTFILTLLPLFKRPRNYILDRLPEYSFPHMTLSPFNGLDSSNFNVIFFTLLYYILYVSLISILTVVLSVIWLPISVLLLVTTIIYTIKKSKLKRK